jgi:tRNA 2-thiocytidine biosynthesis protein TtcA
MLADGDRVLVALSGGKDSLTLMRILDQRRRWAPIRYDLTALYVDPGFPGGFSAALSHYCHRQGYDFAVEKTDYGLQAHGPENRENPCFLCARLRRKRLFELAHARGCNKVAMGHHKDDIIESFFLNVCYAGEISTMLPAQRFFGGIFDLIRPLAYTDEDTIRRFAAEQELPRFENPCPSARSSRRSEIKEMLARLYRGNAKVKGNIFRALHHVNPQYLLKPGP